MERMSLNNSVQNNTYVTNIENISRYLSIYVYFFYVTAGNIGIIFKILFFLQKPVRACPCSAYVILATINDLITLNNIPILNILSNLYPSKKWLHMTIIRSIISKVHEKNLSLVSSQTINMCKIRNYFHMCSTGISIYLLVFASINRYLTSRRKLKKISDGFLTNTFCNFVNAIKSSFVTCIIGALISIHHYFNFIVIENFCIPKNFLVWVIWIVAIHSFIPSILMIIFSTLTLINVRKSSNLLNRSYQNRSRKISNVSKRSNISRHNRHKRSPIDQQLTLMIIIETIATTITTLPYAIYVLYQAFRMEANHSLKSFARENFIEQIIGLTMYVEASCGFYIYLFTLTTLRKRFARVVFNKLRSFFRILSVVFPFRTRIVYNNRI